MSKRIIACLLLIAGFIPVWADKADLNLLPIDITLVYSLNIEPAEKGEMTKAFGRPAAQELEEFKRITSIDIKSETKSVTIGMREKLVKNKTEVIFYTVYRGKFDQKALMAILEKMENPPKGDRSGATVKKEEHLGIEIFTFTEYSLSMCLIEKNVIVSGTPECVKEMIAVKKRKVKAASRSLTIMPLLPASASSSVMWGAYRNDLKKPEEKREARPVLDILMQGRGRRPRRPVGDRIRDIVRNADEIMENDYERMEELYRDLQEFKGLGIENKVLSQVSGGAAVPYIFFNTYLEYGDSKEANTVFQNFRQGQNLLKTAQFKDFEPKGPQQKFMYGMLKNGQAAASGKIVKILFKYEKAKFSEISGMFGRIFLGGFKEGFSKKKRVQRKEPVRVREDDRKVIQEEVPF